MHNVFIGSEKCVEPNVRWHAYIVNKSLPTNWIQPTDSHQINATMKLSDSPAIIKCDNNNQISCALIGTVILTWLIDR